MEKAVQLHLSKFAKELLVKGFRARVRAADEAAKPLTEEATPMMYASFHA